MKKKYTRQQITEAIAYWKKQLKMITETDGNFTIAAHLRGNFVADLYPNHFYSYSTVEKILARTYTTDIFIQYAQAIYGDNVLNVIPIDISKPLSGYKWLTSEQRAKFRENFDQETFDKARANITQLMKSSEWKRITQDEH